MKRNIMIPFLSALCCMASLNTAYAQRKIDPTVEVKKDFEGKMLEIHKSRLDTHVNDSLSSFNLNFNYSIFNKPYRDMYEFNPLPSAKIHSPVTEKYPQFFAKLGIGYPFSPGAEIHYQPRLTKQTVTRNTLLLKGYYNALWGKIPLVGINGRTFKAERTGIKAAADNSAAGISADYRHIWQGGELKAGVHFSSNYNTYYGINGLTPDINANDYGSSKYMRDGSSHTFNKTGIRFQVGSVDAKGKGNKFNYKFYASYMNTSDKISASAFKNNNKFTEDLFKTGGEFGPTFGRYNQFLVGINSETAIYTGYAKFHSGIIELIPQYKFEKGRFMLNAGVKISISYSDISQVNDYHNIFSPHAEVSYEPVKNNLWIYAIAGGGNNINSYSSLLEKNKWVIPSAGIKTSSVPLFLKGGVKGKAHDKFSYEVYIKYAVHKGLLQFVNDIEKTEYFLTGYSDHNEFSAGGEINWKTKEFTAGARIRYSSYTKGKKGTGIENGLSPSGYPPFEGYIFAEYNWRERIYFGADIYFRNTTPFYKNGSLSRDTGLYGFANLGFNAKYVINNNFAVFLQGGNLLNADIQYHPYYLEKGINFGAGLTVKF